MRALRLPHRGVLPLLEVVRRADFSSARAHLVASKPGYHSGAPCGALSVTLPPCLILPRHPRASSRDKSTFISTTTFGCCLSVQLNWAMRMCRRGSEPIWSHGCEAAAIQRDFPGAILEGSDSSAVQLHGWAQLARLFCCMPARYTKCGVPLHHRVVSLLLCLSPRSGSVSEAWLAEFTTSLAAGKRASGSGSPGGASPACRSNPPAAHPQRPLRLCALVLGRAVCQADSGGTAPAAFPPPQLGHPLERLQIIWPTESEVLASTCGPLL